MKRIYNKDGVGIPLWVAILSVALFVALLNVVAYFFYSNAAASTTLSAVPTQTLQPNITKSPTINQSPAVATNIGIPLNTITTTQEPFSLSDALAMMQNQYDNHVNYVNFIFSALGISITIFSIAMPLVTYAVLNNDLVKKLKKQYKDSREQSKQVAKTLKNAEEKLGVLQLDLEKAITQVDDLFTRVTQSEDNYSKLREDIDKMKEPIPPPPDGFSATMHDGYNETLHCYTMPVVEKGDQNSITKHDQAEINPYEYSPLWGKWVLGKVIGRGSERIVFEASKTEINLTLHAAVKWESISLLDSPLHDDTISQRLSEIANEYALGSALESANIANYQDIASFRRENALGFDVFFRQELLIDLEKHIMEIEITPMSAIAVGIDICKALEVIDQHKMVYCDIKPSNIFVRIENDHTSYVLADFSSIIHKDTIGSESIHRAGTPLYSAPEVYLSKQSNNIQSDIYSLGLVMYWMLNDWNPPFEDWKLHPSMEQRETAFQRRLDGEPLPHPVYGDERLWKIINKACSFDRSARYANPSLMRRELEILQKA